jgi:glutamate-1-semialdehyde 2,1-aminomutase
MRVTLDLSTKTTLERQLPMSELRSSTNVNGIPPPSVEQLAFSRRAQDIIPGGAHTYSKGDDQLPVNSPRAFVRGKGARVWDLDGNEYIDWGMGIQSVLVGHAEDAIDDAAVAALRLGQNFSRPTPLEVETGESLVALYRGMDMAKFGKNGSDGNSAAVRLARAITGRKLIAYDQTAPFFSIHDWFIGTTLLNSGIPDEISQLSVGFRYNDVRSVDELFARHGNDLALLVMEVTRDVHPAPGFLETVRKRCDEHGTLLLFDEVISGFRYGLHGAQGHFGVVPDFTTVGKGLSNGYALSALLGRREYMERGGLRHSFERVFLLSTTNGAERSALAAASATIKIFQSRPVAEHLERIGNRLMAGFNDVAARHGISAHLFARSDWGCRPIIYYLDHDQRPSMEYRTLFLQETIRNGVFMPWICPSFAHGEPELSRTLEAVDRACDGYARALEERTVTGLLEGPAAKPVFRKYN